MSLTSARWFRVLAATSAAVVFAVAGGGSALADNVTVDGDVVNVGTQNTVSLGTIPCGSATPRPVNIWITRAGQGTNFNNVFANGTTIDLQASSDTAMVTVAVSQDSASDITIPSDWQAAGNQSTTSTRSATATVNPAVQGAGSATITVKAIGTEVGGASLTRSATLTLSWTAGSCSVPTTTTVTCPSSAQTYTGDAIKPCSATVTGSGGFSQSAPITYSNNSNVGTATASASFAGDATHLASSGSATFAIGKAASTTTVSCPASATWTGAALTPCTAEVTGAGGLDQTLTVSYSANTAVGTATASATFTGDTNHNGSTNTATFGIAKASSTVTVTCPASVLTYTGAAQEPCTAKVTGAGSLDQPLTVAYTANTDAGAATASATYPGDANHQGATGTAHFTIGQATATCSVHAFTGTYDGDAHSLTATCTGLGGTDLTAGFDPGQAFTGAGDHTAHWTFEGGTNYADTSGDGTVSIAKAASTTTVTCPVSVTYDGDAQEPCTASATGAGDLDETLTVTYADNTNAGTATASAVFGGDANHTASDDSTTFEIGKASSVTTVTCPDGPFLYTGDPITPACTAATTGDGGLTASPSVTFSNNTNAGEASASATYPGDANHAGSTGSAHFTIDKAGSVVTVLCTSPVTYNSAAIEPCSAQATGAGGFAQALTVSYSNNTNAGTGHASATFAGDANHNGSVGSATFTVRKATSSTTVTCPTNVTFDGSAHEPCSAVATGVGGLNQVLGVHYADNVHAGSATASASYDGDDNHEGSSDSTTFAIDKATSTTTVTCTDGPFVFNGDDFTPCSATVTGADGLEQALTVTYEHNRNAGTATAKAGYAGDADHEGSSDTETFAIAKAASTTVISCPESQTYAGVALTPCTASVTGAGGLVQSLAVVYGSNLHAGTATAAASFAGDDNHTASSDSTTFVIDKAASVTTVTCTAGPFVFTGSAITPCSASVTGVGGLDETAEVGYQANVHAGTATASASYGGDDDHEASSGSKTFEIGKAASTTSITCPTSVTFTGSAITPCTASLTGAGGLHESLTVTYTANIHAGTATASAGFAGDPDHTGSDDSTTFVIDKAASVTTVTCTAGPHVFDGSAITPCTASLTGAGELDESLTVTYIANIHAGPATASASYAGDDDHTGSHDSTTFVIDKAASVTTVTCTAGPHVFDGSASTPCTASLTGAGGLHESLTVTYTANIHAGTATASAGFGGDPDHTESHDSTTFTIDQAPSAVTVHCTDPVTYTGAALVPCTATATGAGGLSVPLTVTYDHNTNAGVGTASAGYAGDGDHLGSAGEATFTIDKAPSTTTVTCTAGPFVFTGSAFTPCSATVTGVGGLDTSATVSYQGNVNAGEATASAGYEGDADHLASSGSKKFTIAKAPSVVKVTCPSGPFYYTGSSVAPACTAAVTGAGGLDQAVTPVVFSNNTAVGQATASAIYSGDANHLAATGSTTFAISAWTAKGFYAPVDMAGVVNTVKAGSTVPLKFELFAGTTELTTTASVGSFKVTSINCATLGTITEDVIELTTTGGTVLRYDSSGGQFIQNWQTPKSVGSCYKVTMTAADNSAITALFKLK